MGKFLNRVGFLAALAGVAAFFLGTKKGQKMTKVAMNKTEALLNDVRDRLNVAAELTEDKFQEVSEKVLKEWQDTKRLTTEELAEARVQLVRLWGEIKQRGKAALASKPSGEDAGPKCQAC
ncbi:MAG: hypothetical protein V1821_03685 [bacterium]